MDHTRNQPDDAADRDDGPEPTPPSAQPGSTLQRRDDPRGQQQVAHRRHGIAPLLAAAICVFACSALAWAADAAPGQALSVPWAIALGVLQGITEFLPISSDGHLALGQRLLHIDAGGGGHQFTIIVHAGTLLAVIWTYRTDLWQLTHALLRARPSDDERRLLVGMIVASAPLGLVLLPGVEDAVIAFESSIPWIGVFLWITGAALWLGFRHERRHPPPHPGRMPSALQALLIGLAQVTAILPGVSRSGTTISSALLLGIDRVAAARFSFLISVIAVGGAVAKEGLDLVRHGAQGSLGAGPAAAGFAASLVVGLLALRALLLLVKRGQVMGFVVYLAILGGLAVTLG